MPDRKIDGIGNKAYFIGIMMKLYSSLNHSFIGNNNGWVKAYLLKTAASIGAFEHFTHRVVAIINHYNFINDAQMQVGKHMAGTDSGQQQFLGVVPFRVTSECFIGRSQKVWFTIGRNGVVAGISTVSFSART